MGKSRSIPFIFGVTGHRNLRDEDIKNLEGSVRSLFSKYQTDYRHTELIVISALADGADILVAKVAKELGLTLHVVLPYAENAYLETIDSKEDYEKLKAYALESGKFNNGEECTKDADSKHTHCYWKLGKYIADTSNILIALWDGVETKEENGGTASVVRYQRTGFKENRFDASDGNALFIISLTKNLSGFKAFTEQLQHNKVQNIEGFDSCKDKLSSIGKLGDRLFVQGTVFEEYIYHLLCDNFDFDDVMTGVLVEIDEGIRNEFDILMIKDNHLHIIECKLVNGLDGEHFVYKTDLVSEYLDNDGKAMILSIGAKNERITKSGKKRIQFTYGDKARAKYGDIAIHQSEIFDEKTFSDDVREWFCT